MPNPKPPISVTQASRESGIPRRTIQFALTNGELQAHKLPGITGAWVIDPADFDEWVAGRRAGCTRCGGTA